MNRVLEVGYTLNLSGKEFIIKNIVGKGASSVTYLAVYGKTEHILKECNPLGISMYRTETGELVADTELSRQKFEECLERFKKGADKQLSFRLTEDLKNPTSNIQDIYYANGTAYIDMSYFGGKTYDKLDNETLYDLFRRMKALAQIVGHYHKLGYLHLDIKPQNIYTIPETPEMVLMFDFDSVTPVNDVDAIISSSYTDVWAAPEQKMPKYRNQICEATDFFSIGEIIFFKLFGKHSEENDRYSFSQYEYSPENKWFKNVNPRVFPMITELLHKTLSCSAKKRYQNAEQLVEQLDKIIEFSNPKEPFLKNSLPNVSGFFTGRDSEIDEIHERLQGNNVLFLSGIGGIGKSELAKHYAKAYEDEYDAIIFAPFVNDVQMMFADDNYIPIYNFSQYPEEKPNEYFERKMRELAKLCDERILIIVDNFDTTEYENLDKLLSLNCKMLITTRRDFSGFNKHQICVDKLHSNSEIRKIFDTYYKVPDEKESACVDEIIELVDGHTMAVELIAKQIEAEWATATEILDKLKEAGISGIGESDVDSGKDNDLKSKSTYNHIKTLFNFSVFEKKHDENSLYILMNLSLIPYTGMNYERFFKWCELDEHGGNNCINALIKSGWIRCGDKKNNISLHPIVADVAYEKLKTCPWEINASFLLYSEKIIDSEQAKISLHIAERVSKIKFTKVEIAVFLRDVVKNCDSVASVNSSLATSCLLKALEICLDLFGEEHSETANCYFALGKYYETRDINEARGYYKRFFRRSMNEKEYLENKRFESDYAKFSFLINRLGKYIDIGLLSERFESDDLSQILYDYVISFCNKVLSIIENEFNLVDTAFQKTYIILNIYLAIATIKRKDFVLAKQALVQLQECADKINMPDIIEVHHILCGVLNKKESNYYESLCWFKKSITVQEKVDLSHQRITMINYVVLGTIYIERGDWNSAYDCLKKAIEIKESLFKNVSFAEDAFLYEIFGMLSYQKKEYQFAAECFKNALKIFAKDGSIDDEFLIHTLFVNEALYTSYLFSGDVAAGIYLKNTIALYYRTEKDKIRKSKMFLHLWTIKKLLFIHCNLKKNFFSINTAVQDYLINNLLSKCFFELHYEMKNEGDDN